MLAGFPAALITACFLPGHTRVGARSCCDTPLVEVHSLSNQIRRSLALPGQDHDARPMILDRLHFNKDTTRELMHIALPMVVSQGTFAVMIFTDRYFMSQIDPTHMSAALGGGVAVFFSFCFCALLRSLPAIPSKSRVKLSLFASA